MCTQLLFMLSVLAVIAESRSHHQLLPWKNKVSVAGHGQSSQYFRVDQDAGLEHYATYKIHLPSSGTMDCRRTLRVRRPACDLTCTEPERAGRVHSRNITASPSYLHLPIASQGDDACCQMPVERMVGEYIMSDTVQLNYQSEE